MKKFQTMLAKRRAQQGATVIEYALIAALIAVAAITAFRTLGDSVDATMTKVNTELTKE